MRVSGLTADGDWRFGCGKAMYVSRSEAVRQNVVTRLRSFTDDWFLDVTAGIPWFDLLGNKQTEQRIRREVETVVLNTDGVRVINRLNITTDRRNRAMTIELDAVDIFDERFNESLTIP